MVQYQYLNNMDVFAVMEVYFDQILLQSCYIKSQIYEYINFVLIYYSILQNTNIFLLIDCVQDVHPTQGQFTHRMKVSNVGEGLLHLGVCWSQWQDLEQDGTFALHSRLPEVIQCTLTRCKEHKAPILTRI